MLRKLLLFFCVSSFSASQEFHHLGKQLDTKAVPLLSFLSPELLKYNTQNAFLQDFFLGLQSNKLQGNSSACKTKLFSYYTDITSGDPTKMMEAITFLDAAGRPQPGLFTGGNAWMMGDYDGCKKMQNNSDYYSFCHVMATAMLGGVYKTSLNWLGCLPAECRNGNFSALEKELIGLINQYLKGAVYLVPGKSTMQCEVENTYDAGAYAAVIFLAIVSFCIIVGTIWYEFQPILVSLKNEEDTKVLVECEENGVANGSAVKHSDPVSKSVEPESRLSELVKCFAIQRSFPALLNSVTKEGQILCLNGIRVLSINWVVLGHCYMITNYVADDPLYALVLLKRRNFMLVYNGLPSVDTFFTLSGFLVCYLLLRQLTKSGSLSGGQWFAYYVHRYLRLTIPYLLVILVEGFLYRIYATGPLGGAVFDPSHKACKDYWYANLLYINNFLPWNASEQCVGQSWYLANDFQFFAIAPIFIVLLFKIPLGGALTTIGAVVSSAIVSVVLTYHYNLGPSPLGTNPDQFWIMYNKPWARITPYLIGILGGWMYWSWSDKIKSTVNSLPEWKKVLYATPIWLVTAGIQYGVVFGLYDDSQKHYFDHEAVPEVDSIFYLSLARIGWAIALMAQILCCSCGLGGFINSLLSWKGWLVLARLTYSVYLLHIGLMCLLTAGLRAPMKVAPDFNFATWYLGVLSMSYLAAIILYISLEQPLAAIEASTYRKRK